MLSLRWLWHHHHTRRDCRAWSCFAVQRLLEQTRQARSQLAGTSEVAAATLAPSAGEEYGVASSTPVRVDSGQDPSRRVVCFSIPVLVVWMQYRYGTSYEVRYRAWLPVSLKNNAFLWLWLNAL